MKIFDWKPLAANERLTTEINESCQFIVVSLRSSAAIDAYSNSGQVLDNTDPNYNGLRDFIESVIYARTKVSVTLNARTGGEIPLIKDIPLIELGDFSSYDEGANVAGVGKQSDKVIFRIAVKLSEGMISLRTNQYMRVDIVSPVACDVQMFTIERSDLKTKSAWCYERIEIPTGISQRVVSIDAYDILGVPGNASISNIMIDEVSHDLESIYQKKLLQNDLSFSHADLKPLGCTVLTGGETKYFPVFGGSYLTMFEVVNNNTLRHFGDGSETIKYLAVKTVEIPE